ncbi:hypothetical protein [Aliikangiella coralliicola]|uniref:Uncharacterized protein n=1 Tax=Aliikangiella coralliicola TaxID=2592383 RepID=A0A545UIQ7_9GAMM|nr:hypothetical protein [Aliikangiella coralliicola]TQV89346.1 hypothetical protein FLL46_00230 [Aliikangiella coralliicola]
MKLFVRPFKSSRLLRQCSCRVQESVESQEEEILAESTEMPCKIFGLTEEENAQLNFILNDNKRVGQERAH